MTSARRFRSELIRPIYETLPGTRTSTPAEHPAPDTRPNRRNRTALDGRGARRKNAVPAAPAAPTQDEGIPAGSKDPRRALERFQEYLDRKPYHDWACDKLVEAAVSLNELNTRVEACEKRLELDKENRPARVVLGRLQARRGDFDKGLAATESYSPEFRRTDVDETLLKMIASETGGNFLAGTPVGSASDDAAVFKFEGEPARTPHETWWWWLLVACVLLPIDIALRRLWV